MTRPKQLYFTGDPEADTLNATNPLALLIGFALDQQVTVQQAFAGPLKLQQRLGNLDAAQIAATPLDDLEAAFREHPAIHRFPHNMAVRVHELCAHVAEVYGGDASLLWTTAGDARELEKRIRALPGYGDMKVKALGATLANRYGVTAAEPLKPDFMTLGDVDSVEALDAYQSTKRAKRAAARAAAHTTG